MLRSTLRNFVYFTRSSEALLLIAIICGFSIANSQFYEIYRNFFTSHINLSFDFFTHNVSANFSPKFIIDDFLMAIFFLLIGLELKREILIGELSSRDKLILPTVAAIGGVITPALIFYYFNSGNEYNLRGFAIPTATDIALAYAIIKSFGRRISNSAKVFLVTLAVVDDLIAILIIAIFYTKDLQIIYLLYSLPIIIALSFFHFKKSEKLSLYLILGLILWFLILKSGVHPSFAGVVLAMLIPFKTANKFLLENLAQKLSPLVSFIILPIFIFANSGVKISNFSSEILLDKIVLGIIFGLFFGKQIGIFLFSFFAIKSKICKLPQSSSWLELYGTSILAGIGFTMSLFIGKLAFDDDYTLDKVKIAILIGSIISFIFGSIILLMTKKKSVF